ncbi:MAG: 4-hydroxythreonine-4-phosphate dehydrogenase PdxA [Legionella sp.]|nr:MAG: 4-hydroxythreonine-4-phosphate dehydrogenase PdxA [Legionella sp.]
MKPLLVSSGEPAGIGPDICLALAESEYPVVILGDQSLLASRAKRLNLPIDFALYQPNKPLIHKPGQLTVFDIPCHSPVQSGQLNPNNAQYVIELLEQGAALCASGEFSALITAPVHKGNINAGGITFTGHTEFFADYFKVPQVVMLLACAEMKVALVTTHLPLRDVPNAINKPLIIRVLEQLHHSLVQDFGISDPLIKVAGLNPHAGESGYLGREEIDIINPALEQLRAQGMQLLGPLPADTMFTQDKNKGCDAYVAMYHDQGLPVLKYIGFHHAVNITLGLPIIRTSVDHGTALELAGTGLASADSLLTAVQMAKTIVENRTEHESN